MPGIEAEAVIRDRNQMTLPSAIVEARNLSKGMRFTVHIDDERPDEIVLRAIPPSYAGVLGDAFGTTTAEQLAYIRDERASWGE
jgi:hypothetical protein